MSEAPADDVIAPRAPWLTLGLAIVWLAVQVHRAVFAPAPAAYHAVATERAVVEAEVLGRYHLGEAPPEGYNDEQRELLARFRAMTLTGPDDPDFRSLRDTEVGEDLLRHRDLAERLAWRPSAGLAPSLFGHALGQVGWWHLGLDLLALLLLVAPLERRLGALLVAMALAAGAATGAVAVALVQPDRSAGLVGGGAAMAAVAGVVIVRLRGEQFRFIGQSSRLPARLRALVGRPVPAGVALAIGLAGIGVTSLLVGAGGASASALAALGALPVGAALAALVERGGLERRLLERRAGRRSRALRSPEEELAHARDLLARGRTLPASVVLRGLALRLKEDHALYEETLLALCRVCAVTGDLPSLERHLPALGARLLGEERIAELVGLYRAVEAAAGSAFSAEAQVAVAEAVLSPPAPPEVPAVQGAAELVGDGVAPNDPGNGPALAIRALERLLHDAPASPLVPRALWDLAVAAEQAGGADESRAVLERLIHEHPLDAFATWARRRLSGQIPIYEPAEEEVVTINLSRPPAGMTLHRVSPARSGAGPARPASARLPRTSRPRRASQRPASRSATRRPPRSISTSRGGRGVDAMPDVPSNHLLDAVPPGLIQAINRGHCVAFVGAGFSAAAHLPSWKELLGLIADDPGVPEDVRAYVHDVLQPGAGAAHELDRAAQLLTDVLGRQRLLAGLRRHLRVDIVPPDMARRRELLLSIPFAAILTLNFDGILGGMLPGPASYEEVLRPGARAWWNRTVWDPDFAERSILNLHGDLRTDAGASEVVLAREDYRRRLYRDPAYATFLRTVFATHDVLYLGVSFTDAYLNELRSEVLAMLGYGGGRQPRTVAYAVVEDVPAPVIRHYREHEGIEVLPFDTRCKTDYSGFDAWLERIHDRTSAVARLGALLQGRRILWLDRTRDASVGQKTLLDAARSRGAGAGEVAVVQSLHEAFELLDGARRSGRAWDLVISMWHGSPEQAWGIQLLEHMRREDHRSPVIVFAGPRDADERKRVAMGLGAFAYCVEFETLFRKIEELLAPAAQTW